MRIFVYTLALIVFSGCGSSAGKKSKDTGMVASRLYDEDILTGKITREDLLVPPFDFWYNAHHKSYTPAEKELAVIRKNIRDYEIKIFLGTWCADSQREVPRFIKLLELSDIDPATVSMEGVELDKTMPGGIPDDNEVVRVPTIIFYKNGVEINRFVEFPQETLEKDIAKIVSGENYRHPYLDL